MLLATTTSEILLECAEKHKAWAIELRKQSKFERAEQHTVWELHIRIAAAELKKSEKKPRKRAAHLAQIPTLEECIDYAAQINMPEREGRKFFNHWEGVKWIRARTPIKDWQATARSWRSIWEEKNPVEARVWNNRTNSERGLEPAGWEDFCAEHNLGKLNYAAARGYVKEDFKKWISQ